MENVGSPSGEGVLIFPSSPYCLDNSIVKRNKKKNNLKKENKNVRNLKISQINNRKECDVGFKEVTLKACLDISFESSCQN